MLSLSLFSSVIDDRENDKKFTELYNLYEKKIFAITYNKTGNFHDAEEAAQNALFALARNIDKLDIADGERTEIYVYKTAKNAAYDLLRKRKREPSLLNIADCTDVATDYNVANNVSEAEELSKLVKIVASLPESYRDVLSLYFLGGFSAAEIADLLHRPTATVKSQLNRGKQLLKRRLREEKIV